VCLYVRCVSVCCSVLQRVAVYVQIRCMRRRCVSLCQMFVGVLQCVAACCSVCTHIWRVHVCLYVICLSVYCSVLQCVAVYVHIHGEKMRVSVSDVCECVRVSVNIKLWSELSGSPLLSFSHSLAVTLVYSRSNSFPCARALSLLVAYNSTHTHTNISTDTDTDTDTDIHKLAYAHAHTQAHIRTRIHAREHARANTYINTKITHARAHAYAQAHTHTHTHTHTTHEYKPVYWRTFGNT